MLLYPKQTEAVTTFTVNTVAQVAVNTASRF